METIHLQFVGPFSWPGTSDAPSILECPEGQQAGVYLWTVPLHHGHLIYYVGETGRSFSSRMLEHYQQHTVGFYHIYSPTEFAGGKKVLLWPGRYDATNRRSPVECIQRSVDLAPQIADLSRLYRFFLAPTTVETRVRRRVEAAIARLLYEAPGLIGGFQDRGVRYAPRSPNETPLSCAALAPVSLLGLPSEFSA